MNVSAPRVATVTSAHAPNDIRVVWKECSALAEEFETTLIAPQGRLPSGHARYAYRPLKVAKSRPARFILGPLRCLRELRRGKFDVVHGHDPELLPLLFLWKVLHPGAVVIYDAHESLPEQIVGKRYIPRLLRPAIASLSSRLLSLVTRKIDAVVAATPRIAENTPSHNRCEVVVVQNFPWLRDYPEPVPLGHHVAPSLCYIGAVSEARGRRTMEILGSRMEELRVSVAGGGALPNDESAVPGNVRYIGRIDAGSVPAFIREHSVGLALLDPLPNYLWSQPTKIFEYMASARPFVASDLPRWRELFDGLDVGFLVDPSNLDEVEAATRRLFEEPGLAREYGIRGRRAIENFYSFENEAAKLTALYRKLLDGRNRGL